VLVHFIIVKRLNGEISANKPQQILGSEFEAEIIQNGSIAQRAVFL
jgi:hypothetical protein